RRTPARRRRPRLSTPRSVSPHTRRASPNEPHRLLPCPFCASAGQEPAAQAAFPHHPWPWLRSNPSPPVAVLGREPLTAAFFLRPVISSGTATPGSFPPRGLLACALPHPVGSTRPP